MKIEISKYAVMPSNSNEARLLRDALDMATDALGETEDPAVVAELDAARRALPHRNPGLSGISLSLVALESLHLALRILGEWTEEPDFEPTDPTDGATIKALDAELTAMLSALPGAELCKAPPVDAHAVLSEVWQHWAGGDVPPELEAKIRRVLDLPAMQGEASPS